MINTCFAWCRLCWWRGKCDKKCTIILIYNIYRLLDIIKCSTFFILTTIIDQTLSHIQNKIYLIFRNNEDNAMKFSDY